MPKMKWIIGILLIALIACAPAEKPSETMEKPEVMEKETTPVEKTPTQTTPTEMTKQPTTTTTQPATTPPQETTTQVVVEQKDTMNPQIKDLLKRVDEKVKSVSYLYGGTETKNLFLDTYYLKGDQVKIKKYSEDYYVKDGYYDNVYVNLGIACCEELSRCRSHNVDNTGKTFEIDTSTLYMPKTPIQWAKEIPANAKVLGPQTIDERSVTYIQYTQDGVQYDIWLDDTYGVAHKVVVNTEQGPITYKFNDMNFNSLKDTDFDAPCD